MNAIFGIFHRDGAPVTQAEMQAMKQGTAGTASMKEESWFHGSAGLGTLCQRPGQFIDTIPARENQRPRVSADIRLDNRADLFNMLGLRSSDMATTSDQALLLLCYQRWKTETHTKLVGDFAFAIWDSAEKHFYCARDHLGTRPFYYALNRKEFTFSSIIRPIIDISAGNRELDLAYIRAAIEEVGFYHPERTHWAGINKLPAAHAIIVGLDGIKKWKYWDPARTHNISYSTESEYIDHFRELLNESVRCRLLHHENIGSHLSGGLDSTTVTVLASRLSENTTKNVTAFSWAPPPESNDLVDDERSIVLEVSRTAQIPVQFTALTAKDVLEYDSKNVLLEPVRATLWESVVTRNAAERGISVMLSGWGGDEAAAFNGRGYFAELFMQGKWTKLAHELRCQAGIQGGSAWRAFIGRAVLPLLPDPIATRLRPNLRFPSLTPLSNLLTSTFRQRLENVPALEHPLLRERRGVHRNQVDLLTYGHLADRMESWWQLGWQHGIEYGYPLLDRRIVEFSLGISPDLFFKNGWKRYLFRHATEGMLPPEAQWLKRKGDPAICKHMDNIDPDAEKLVLSRIVESRDEIRRAGRLDIDRVLEKLSVSQQQGDTSAPGKIEAESILWLAFMDEELSRAENRTS